MDRLEEARLLDFCVSQRDRFDADSWLEAAQPRDRLSLVAYLLSGARWYGHRDELLALARDLDPRTIGNAAEAVARLDFDCSRFCHMLRTKLEHALRS